MTESKERKPRTAPADRSRGGEAARQQRDASDDAERSLGRAVAFGLPVVALIAAVGVGLLAGLGSGLLVLAAGALLGTIALLWASVRTLSGDAPLPTGLETVEARRHGVDALAEEKRRVLRQLKDLEAEHALGKIDDVDYEALVARYRAEAKTVMREMDREIGPRREEAERLAREYLAKRGLVDGAPAAEPAPEPVADRAACAGCGASNESDAAFCKKCGAAMKPLEEKADVAS
jgi:ribosomal protein L40E